MDTPDPQLKADPFSSTEQELKVREHLGGYANREELASEIRRLLQEHVDSDQLQPDPPVDLTVAELKEDLPINSESSEPIDLQQSKPIKSQLSNSLIESNMDSPIHFNNLVIFDSLDMV